MIVQSVRSEFWFTFDLVAAIGGHAGCSSPPTPLLRLRCKAAWCPDSRFLESSLEAPQRKVM